MAEEHDSWLQGIGVDVGNVLDTVKQDVQDAGSTVTDTANTVVADVKDAGTTISNAATIVSNDAQDVSSAVSDAKTSLDQGTDDLGGAVGTASTRIIRDVQDASTTISAAVTTVKDDKADIKDAIDDAKQQLTDDQHDAENAVLLGVGTVINDTDKAVIDTVVDTVVGAATYQPPRKYDGPPPAETGGGGNASPSGPATPVVPASQDGVFNTAFNISVDVTVGTDGTWSYTWNWSYGGTQLIPTIHEEILITTPKGVILDGNKEADHSAEPGQTYLGGGNGRKKLPGGNLTWKLNIPYRDGYIGVGSGSFFAMVALQR